MKALRHFLFTIANQVAKLGVVSRRTTERFFEYGISTGISTAIEFVLLFLLVQYVGWHYLVAAAIAFFVKVTFLFFITFFTAFRGNRVDAKTAYMKFFGIYLFNLVIILIFMKVAVETLNVNYLLARGILLLVMVFWSFYANAKFNFRIIK